MHRQVTVEHQVMGLLNSPVAREDQLVARGDSVLCL